MRHDLEKSGPFLGIGGLAVAAFLYGYTAFVVPGLLYSVVLPLAWLALFVLACRCFTGLRVAVGGLPVAAVALWFLVLLGVGA